MVGCGRRGNKARRDKSLHDLTVKKGYFDFYTLSGIYSAVPLDAIPQRVYDANAKLNNGDN